MGNRKMSSTNFVNETFLEERCVLNKVITIIGKRWVSEILLLIEKNINRFSGLKECLDGISDNVLSNNLTELVKAGFLQKKIYEQVPLKVEYSLSESGLSLVNRLHELCSWGKENIEK
jgi:DNA-binding HxlR family transcriptional regulator